MNCVVHEHFVYVEDTNCMSTLHRVNVHVKISRKHGKNIVRNLDGGMFSESRVYLRDTFYNHLFHASAWNPIK